jgi:hypothetical protein
MGILDWFKSDEEDRSLIEISNDSGDHWVADIPTRGVKATEKALRDAGVERDTDERLLNIYQPSRIVDSRDPKQYRYRAERVVDEGEDLEDSHDQENDQSDWEDNGDVEASEHPATWGWW